MLSPLLSNTVLEVSGRAVTPQKNTANGLERKK